MDRHVRWLRRRVVASVGVQTAATFALVAAASLAVIGWRSDQHWLGSLFASLVIAQIIAAARIFHAVRNNPLNHSFVQNYIDDAPTYEVVPFGPPEDIHPATAALLGYTPVATLQGADGGPIFDILQDQTGMVVASVSRASGAVALLSSLAGNRLLVTDACTVPPHERVVVNLAPANSPAEVIAAHDVVLRRRTDAVALATDAGSLVLDSLRYEHESYVELGPLIAPFLDLEASPGKGFRLTARVTPGELATVEHRCGPHRLPHLRPALAAPLTPR